MKFRILLFLYKIEAFIPFFLLLSNICDAPRQLTKNGIILSWAVEGQGGTDHVNEQNNTVIVQVSSDPIVDLLKKIIQQNQENITTTTAVDTE